MKIYIVTDMEGVSGVVNFDDWAFPQGRYYDEGKKLLALEVNAAIDGFFTAGATEILVSDLHGYGGVNNLLLDPRALYLRGPMPGPYPLMIDDSYDAIAFVGQHAKAGTEFAQMAHTGGLNVIDYTINGISVGEFGQIVMLAASFGVRTIFGSGDEAFEKEAAELVGGIETVSVKRGIMPGSGDEYNTEGYQLRNNGAIHMHPDKAREQIRKGAEKALKRFAENKEQFALIAPKVPIMREVSYRSWGARPAYTDKSEHTDMSQLLNHGRPKT
jgi:D-amino peptidase